MKSKLAYLLEILTLQQWKDLMEFVRMPSNRLLKSDLDFFNALFKESRKRRAFIDEEAVWSKVSRKGRENKKQAKNRLLRVLNRYISLIQLESDNNLKNLMIAQFYLTNNLDSNTQKAISKGFRDLKVGNSYNFKNEIFRFWMLELCIERDKDKRNVSEQLNSMEKALKNFHELNRVRLICEMANGFFTINKQIDLDKFNSEVSTIFRNSDSKHTKAFCNIYHLITKQQSLYQTRLEEYIEVHRSYLDIKFLKELYDHLLNFCIRKINRREYSFAEKYLEYNKIQNELNQLLNKEVVNFNRLRNIVLACLILKRINQAREFINNYLQQLNLKDRAEEKPFIELNLALVNLHDGKIDECHKQIVNFQLSTLYKKDVYYRVTCDSLLLKVFFEKGDHNYFLTMVKKFKKFVRGLKELAPEKKQPFLNLADVLVQLTRGKKINMDDIEQKILITDLLWLKK